MAEANPEALVIPTVLFTDRKRWRKTVPKVIDHEFGNRRFLHFEYLFVKLFDFKAKDHYNSGNPSFGYCCPRWITPRQSGERYSDKR
jgi:IS1 family transposase